ncbi:MAG: SAM-dependent methyltransferase [Desulfobacteraceae bacterium]|nr:MAG: SAM-dependent methyltransferase [Desulfobacteraceae bacterium]
MNQQKWTPGSLLELSGSYWRACALHTAVELACFSVISGDGMTDKEIAHRIGGDRRAVETLLNALVAMGLLVKMQNNGYQNTAFSTKYLSRSSSHYIGHIISHHHHLVESWARLDESVMTGQPVRERSSHGDEKARESFLMGMFNLAMAIAPDLVKQIDLANRVRLLDLGGGPGTYAVHFCLHNPKLQAVVFDLPDSRSFAENVIARFGLSDRIAFQGGDFLSDGIDGKFDAAWLSHILHGEGPEGCRQIMEKAAAALEPGGLILIHEFILNDTMDGPLFPALFSLNMLLGTPNGRSYSEAQLMRMLKSAGFRDIQRLPFSGPNDSGIIAGIR